MSETIITIIGGGACGVAAFIELVLQLKVAGLHQKTKIILIERRKEVGQGLAFGTEQPGQLLNTQAELMGIYAFEPAHFSDWLKEHRKSANNEVESSDGLDNSYTTRRLYGDYMKEQFQHNYQRAKEAGMKIEIIHEEVTDLSFSEKQWQVYLASGRTYESDYIILLPGTPKPNNYPELKEADQYFDFPWPSQPIIEGIPKKAHVGILGSSLSAIDTIMTLTDNGHEGIISLYSHDGLLPRVQPAKETQYERKFLTQAAVHKIRRTHLRSPKITEIFRLFQQEAERYEGKHIDWDKTERKGKPTDELLKEDISIAEAGGDAFINILYSLRYEASPIWSWLSTAEKQKFKHWLGSYWTITRHGMPLVNAKRLKNLFESRKLEAKAGLQKVTYQEETRKFALHYGENGKDEVPYLINATGPAHELKEMKNLLLQNLQKSGILEPYKAGGIKMDPGSMEVLSSQRVFKNLYTAGHICNGLLLDINSVWFNVKTIVTLCEGITKKIRDANYS